MDTEVRESGFENFTVLAYPKRSSVVIVVPNRPGDALPEFALTWHTLPDSAIAQETCRLILFWPALTDPRRRSGR